LNELGRDEIATEAIELPAERTKSGLAHTIPITPMIRHLAQVWEVRAQRNRSSIWHHSGAKEKH
jgi:hypothetical protein